MAPPRRAAWAGAGPCCSPVGAVLRDDLWSRELLPGGSGPDLSVAARVVGDLIQGGGEYGQRGLSRREGHPDRKGQLCAAVQHEPGKGLACGGGLEKVVCDLPFLDQEVHQLAA